MNFKMVHENYNVADLEKSMAFYEKALGLTEKRRINGNGFIIVYLGNDNSDFELELTWLKDHPQKYDLGEFATLFQELNNHTRKQINRGHTPDELFKQTHRGMQLLQRLAPENQISLFDEVPVKPKLTIVGGPSRNGPCPCGSGRKYKNCCGR